MTTAVLSDPPTKRSLKPAREVVALSARDLAAMFSVSIRQVWAMHASGALGPIPVSLSDRVTRWDRKEVDLWWAACRAAGRAIKRAEWLSREGRTHG
jgi:predicted DNA-binding transcriptional regulator AlpA